MLRYAYHTYLLHKRISLIETTREEAQILSTFELPCCTVAPARDWSFFGIRVETETYSNTTDALRDLEIYA